METFLLTLNTVASTGVLHKSSNDIGATPVRDDELDSTCWFFDVIWLAIICFIYTKMVYARKPILPPKSMDADQALRGGDFNYHVCGCLGDMETCCLTTLAHSCRIADTYVTAGFLPRSPDAWLGAIAFHLFPFCFICCYFPCKRSALRAHLGGSMNKGDCGGWCGCGYATFGDWLTVVSFPFCAAVQEARAVDSIGGVETTICCGLRGVGPHGAPVVFDPILVVPNETRNMVSAPLLDRPPPTAPH
eukprot:GEMP01067749.1.p1 GENE.GEMP01067749.1~~GEMP01067749.1.p1  ORF type:complete len:247 (+),score=33.93 GEMP01067749.1:126-866(+)